MQRAKTENYTFDNLDNTKKIYLLEIKNNPLMSSLIDQLNISDECLMNNVGKLYIHMQQIEKCKNCKGLNECNNDDCSGYINELKNENGRIINLVKPCKYLEHKMNFDQLSICNDYDGKSINSLKDIDIISEQRKLLCSSLFSCLKNNKGWIYIKGNHATGKSFVAQAFHNEYIKQKKLTSAFINSYSKLGEMSDTYFKNKDKYNELFNIYCNVDCLIIDDFGREYKNSIVRDSIFIPLLVSRKRNKKITIFTSIFSIKDVIQMYKLNKYQADPFLEELKDLLLKECGKEIDLGDTSVY